MMTPDFKAWFEDTFRHTVWKDEESREEIELYTWLAWRDSRRKTHGEYLQKAAAKRESKE